MAQQGHSHFEFYQDEREEEKKELLLLPVSNRTACNIDGGVADFSALFANETAVDLSALLDSSSNQETVAASQELLDELTLLRTSCIDPRSRSPRLMQSHQPKMEQIPTSRSDQSGVRHGLAIHQFPTQSMLSFDSATSTMKTTPTPSPMLVDGISSASSSGDLDQVQSRKMSAGLKRRWHSMDKNSDEYRKRRERNNVAVKKSREKSRIRSVQTEHRVSELTQENQRLHGKIALLTKELDVLKSLFANHGVSGGQAQLMIGGGRQDS